MKNILLVGLKPYCETAYRLAHDCSCISCSSLQNVCSKNDSCFSIPSHFEPLKLNFFKNAEQEYVYCPATKVLDCADFDYVLFAADNHITTFYAIIEFCERNNIPVDKILFKDIFKHNIHNPKDVLDIDHIQHFWDMSIDDFVTI